MTQETGIIYSHYKFTAGEWFKHLLMGGLYFFVMGMIFYQNIGLSLIASIGTVLYVRDQRIKSAKDRKKVLLLQFREGMYALGSSLSAGRSVEQAFGQSLKDLTILFPEGGDIVDEWQLIVQKVSMNVLVEDDMEEHENRTQVEYMINVLRGVLLD